MLKYDISSSCKLGNVINAISLRKTMLDVTSHTINIFVLNFNGDKMLKKFFSKDLSDLKFPVCLNQRELIY